MSKILILELKIFVAKLKIFIKSPKFRVPEFNHLE